MSEVDKALKVIREAYLKILEDAMSPGVQEGHVDEARRYIPLERQSSVFQPKFLRRAVKVLAEHAGETLSDAQLDAYRVSHRTIFAILIIADLTNLFLDLLKVPIIQDTSLPFLESPTGFTGTESQFQDFKQAQWIFFPLPLSIYKTTSTTTRTYSPILPLQWVHVKKDGQNLQCEDVSQELAQIHGGQGRSVVCTARPTCDGFEKTPVIIIKQVTCTNHTKCSYEQEIYKKVNERLTDPFPLSILRLYEDWHIPNEHLLVLEYADMGTLEDYWDNQVPPKTNDDVLFLWVSLLRLSFALFVVQQELGQLEREYSGQRLTYHIIQDIRPGNILVKSCGQSSPYCWQFILSDFDLTEPFDPGRDSPGIMYKASSLEYSGPKTVPLSKNGALTGVPTTQVDDIWALGCVFYNCGAWIIGGREMQQELRDRRANDIIFGNYPGQGAEQVPFHEAERRLPTVSTTIQDIVKNKRYPAVTRYAMLHAGMMIQPRARSASSLWAAIRTWLPDITLPWPAKGRRPNHPQHYRNERNDLNELAASTDGASPTLTTHSSIFEDQPRTSNYPKSGLSRQNDLSQVTEEAGEEDSGDADGEQDLQNNVVPAAVEAFSPLDTPRPEWTYDSMSHMCSRKSVEKCAGLVEVQRIQPALSRRLFIFVVDNSQQMETYSQVARDLIVLLMKVVMANQRALQLYREVPFWKLSDAAERGKPFEIEEPSQLSSMWRKMSWNSCFVGKPLQMIFDRYISDAESRAKRSEIWKFPTDPETRFQPMRVILATPLHWQHFEEDIKIIESLEKQLRGKRELFEKVFEGIVCPIELVFIVFGSQISGVEMQKLKTVAETLTSINVNFENGPGNLWTLLVGRRKHKELREGLDSKKPDQIVDLYIYDGKVVSEQELKDLGRAKARLSQRVEFMEETPIYNAALPGRNLGRTEENWSNTSEPNAWRPPAGKFGRTMSVPQSTKSTLSRVMDKTKGYAQSLMNGFSKMKISKKSGK